VGAGEKVKAVGRNDKAEGLKTEFVTGRIKAATNGIGGTKERNRQI